MAIINVEDAQDLDNQFQSIFGAWGNSHEEWIEETRRLFLLMDFEFREGLIDLSTAPPHIRLPDAANHIAHVDNIEVLCIQLPYIAGANKKWMNRKVNKREADSAFKIIESQLQGEILLALMNPEGSELNIIYPTYQGLRVVLRRVRVERDRPNRTVAQQISNIRAWRQRPGIDSHQALLNVFDKEPITEIFFGEYHRLFTHAKSLINGFHDEQNLHIFTQALFNRLLFIHFISKKNWMCYEGNHDYLNSLWRAHQSDTNPSKNFYRDRLNPLFEKGLNNPEARSLRTTDTSTWLAIGDVPFLNGGLFDDQSSPSGIDIPDDAIEPIFSELFGRFNFSGTESTPFDIEIAVDPEMLGKVFEELVTRRNESGCFYTPRNVVSFMCREGLKGYLKTSDVNLDDKAINQFIDDKDISRISRIQAVPLMAALRSVTVLDPACGSGAYLLGMMQELLDLQILLVNGDLIDEPEDLHKFKMDIIQNNVYGTDLDELAVTTAKLRLCLSVTIEFEGDNPPPLPNLEFTIAEGNSLTGPVQQGTKLSLLAKDTVSELAKVKRLYMNATPEAKNEIRIGINQKLAELTAAIHENPAPTDAVDWRAAFGEVLATGGFDIVVANPPYVRQEAIQYKDRLQPLFTDGVTRRSDLYCYFYVRGLQLLKPDGMHVFVCSNSWLDVGYGGKLQEYILNNSSVESIYESAVEKQFSSAAINTIISVIRKSPGKGASVPNLQSTNTRFVQLRAPLDAALSDISNRRERVLGRTELLEAGLGAQNAMGTRKYEGSKWGGKYMRAPDIYWHIVEKCRENLVTLGSVSEIRRGVTTGANDFFFLDEETKDYWEIEDEYLVPLINSFRKIRRLKYTQNSQLLYCHKSKSELAGTGVLRYIQHGESENYHLRSSVQNRSPNWYSLKITEPDFLLPRFWDKRFWTPIPKSSGVYCSDTFMFGKSKTAAGVLNILLNTSFHFLQLEINGRVNQGAGVLATYGIDYEKVLVPSPSLLTRADRQSGLELLDRLSERQLLPVWEEVTTAERQELDSIVFRSLGLSSEEYHQVQKGLCRLTESRIARSQSV